MPIQDHWNIDTNNKRIYHTAGSVEIYTVNALYSWLMDEFDAQGAMDDEIPMTAQTPTEYTMVNGWYIEDKGTNFLKNGAIKTDGYLNNIQDARLNASGYVNCVASDIGNDVLDTGGSTLGPLLDYNNTTRQWWIRTGSGSPIVSGNTIYVSGGTGGGTMSADSIDGEYLYSNVYTLGGIESGSTIYITQSGVRIDPDWWDEGHIDILLKVKEDGSFISGGTVTFYLRQWTDLYDHYEIDLSAGGRNAVPLATSNDLDNASAVSTIAQLIKNIRVMFVNALIPFSGQSGDSAAVGKAVRDTSTNATAYILEVSGTTLRVGNREGTFTENNIIEIMEELKFTGQQAAFNVGDIVVGESSSSGGTVRLIEQLYVDGGTVGKIYMSGITGTFSDGEYLTVGGSTIARADGTLITNTFGATIGAVSVVNTINKDLDNGNGPQPYNVVIDLNTETVAELYEFVKEITRSGSTYTMYLSEGGVITKKEGQQYQSAISTYLQKKASPFGTFAGGKFFGARGIWIEDMASSDIRLYSLIDANGVVQDPPNRQNFEVTSLVSGDRVAIFLSTGSGSTTINKSQYTNVAQSSGLTYVEVQESIPADCPDPTYPGNPPTQIRVRYNIGLETEGEDIYTVTSLDKPNKRFNISGTTVRAYTTSDRSYVPYMDLTADATSEVVTVTYTTDRYLLVRVRKKGIIPFQTTGTFGSAGYTVSAIRTTDSIVT